MNLGFANQERFITPAGRALLGQIQIEKDGLELIKEDKENGRKKRYKLQNRANQTAK